MKTQLCFLLLAICLFAVAKAQSYISMSTIIAERCNYNTTCIANSVDPVDGAMLSTHYNSSLQSWTHYN